ncbi:hypothetical protein [Candidatus Orientia mediorientalis]|uniref:hypothetical protein n=1 Tax=Candidatus Orientia mediorientalis TaxID=911112 RepID=UPI001E4EDDF0|nr:hypothetical protein [Candidatus Orientia mediorientalis]
MQVTSFEKPKAVSRQQISEEEYLLELSKQLDSNSIWYKVLRALVKTCSYDIDKTWFSKLEVIQEDNVNNIKTVLIKPYDKRQRIIIEASKNLYLLLNIS